MKLIVSVDGDLNAMMGKEFRAGERAVTSAIEAAALRVKADWRGQVAAALGTRLGNVIRAKRYPSGQQSMNAAALVFSKAPQIISAHESGATIRSAGGAWLAIPTPAAGRGRRGGRITPDEWEKRHGTPLQFILPRAGLGLLVADKVRLNNKGRAVRSRSKTGKNQRTVVIFTLVPQVKLKKVLNLYPAAEQAAAGVPAAIVAQWRDTR